MVDFSDREQVEAWAKGLSPEARTVFASRAALRVLALLSQSEKALSGLALPVQRAALTSCARAVKQSANINSACEFAFVAATDVANEAAFLDPLGRRGGAPIAAHAAATAARSSKAKIAELTLRHVYKAAAAAQSDTGNANATGIDARCLGAGLDPAGLFARPLWPEGVPKRLDEALRLLRAFWDQAPELWGFWRRWYDGMLAGEPLDWELQRRVALIPDEVWQAGPKSVAAAIAAIEAERLAEETATAETVLFDPALGLFDRRAVEVRRPDVLARAVSRVEDCFDDALALGRGQHVREDRLEALILRRVFRKYRQDAARVEQDFVEVRDLLVRQVAAQEYPETEELTVLINALTVAAGEICDSHPEVAENRERIDGQEAAPVIPDETRDQIAAALPALRAVSTPELAEGLAEDAYELVNDAIGPPPDGAPPLGPAGPRPVRPSDARPRKSVLRRFAYRVARIRSELGEAMDRVRETPEYKAMEVAAVLNPLVSALLQLLPK